uniref:DDE Tnp4 domain-containing protein n=1 Tax=Fagus sylvatica TaxID=28930 RepID=A0A2N9HAH3_FAGSY
MDRHPIFDIIANDSSSSSDDEMEMILRFAIEEERLNSGGGSRPRRRRTFIPRDFVQATERIIRDYFAEPPLYPPNIFRRRFRMSRSLFLRIKSTLEATEPYFVQRRNAAGKLGLSSIQKMTAAIRMLAYGTTADLCDEYVSIGETTAMKCVKKFVKAVISNFSEEYLRSPTNNDIARLLALGESRGFPGMLGSIDCMHWKWKNCPTAWQGNFTGHIHEPTIILEAVASYDLWIWHAFFGLPGSHNDINVLERSSVFTELAEGRAPLVNYSINGNNYTMGYYLADGIYPTWSTFVKTIPSPRGPKKTHFAKKQEEARKDVERAFGVLQSRFAIVRGPARFFQIETLKDIMTACIILHNMIIEDERHIDEVERGDYQQFNETTLDPVSHAPTLEFMDFIQQTLGQSSGTVLVTWIKDPVAWTPDAGAWIRQKLLGSRLGQFKSPGSRIQSPGPLMQAPGSDRNSWAVDWDSLSHLDQGSSRLDP